MPLSGFLDTPQSDTALSGFLADPVEKPDESDVEHIKKDAHAAGVIEYLNSGGDPSKISDHIDSISAEVDSTGMVQRFEKTREEKSKEAQAAKEQLSEMAIMSDKPVDKRVSDARAIGGSATKLSYSDSLSEQAMAMDNLSVLAEKNGLFWFGEAQDEEQFSKNKDVVLTGERLFKAGIIDSPKASDVFRLGRRLLQPEDLISAVYKAKTKDDLLALVSALHIVSAKETTSGGVWDGIKAEGSSVTNWAMLAVGVGEAKIVAQLVAKGVLSKAAQKIIMSRFTQLGVSGATYGAVQNLSEQVLNKKAGLREDISASEVATTAAISSVATVAGGEAIRLAPILAKKGMAALTKWRTSSIKTGINVPVIEPPEDTFAAVTPKPNGSALHDADALDLNEVLNRQPDPSTTETFIKANNIILAPMSDQERKVMLDSAKAHAMASAKETGVVPNPQYSEVSRDGDNIITKVAVGKTRKGGYASLTEAADVIKRIRDKATVETQFTILKRESNGAYQPVSPVLAQVLLKQEQAGVQTTGKFIVQFTQDIPSGGIGSAVPFVDNTFRGMSSRVGKFFSTGIQQSEEFFKPFSWGASKTSRFKQLFEKPFDDYMNLGVFDRDAVDKVLTEGDGIGYLTRSQALLKLDNDAVKANAYIAVTEGFQKIHQVADALYTQSMREKGFKFHQFTLDGKVFFKGGAQEIGATKAGSKILGAASHALDKDGNLVKLDPLVRNSIGLGELKAYIIADGDSRIIAGENHHTNILLMPTKEGVKHEVGVLNSALHQTPGYVGRSQHPAWVIYEKANKFFVNGKEIAKDDTLALAKGQRALTRAYADTEEDALRFIADQKKKGVTVEYEKRPATEISGGNVFGENGMRIGSQGIIYGARSQEGDIVHINGAGKPSDIVSSIEEYTHKVANAIGYDRVVSSAEFRWLKTFLPNAKNFPRTRAQAQEAVDATYHAASSVKEKGDYAIKAWDAIEVQRGVMDSSARRAMTKTVFDINNTLSTTPLLKGLAPVYRYIGRGVAEGASLEQTAKAVAFNLQVVNFAQMALSLGQSAGVMVSSALYSPRKVFARTLYDTALYVSGKNETLSRQITKGGFFSAIEQNELIGHLRGSRGGESSKLGLAGKAVLSKAKAATVDIPKSVFFIAPEKIVRFTAFVKSRADYMAEKGIKATKLTDDDLVTIQARASVLAGAMDKSGRVAAYSAPVAGTILQYGGFSYKMTALLTSGLPLLSESGVAQKVVPKKQARALVAANMLLYGVPAGIGGVSAFDWVFNKYAPDVDPTVKKFFQDGVAGNALDMASNNLVGNQEDDINNMDSAYGARISMFSGSGFEQVFRAGKTIVDLATGNTDPQRFVNSIPLVNVGLAGYDSLSAVKSIYMDVPDDDLMASDKLKAAALKVLELHAIPRSIIKTFDAIKSGQMRDKYGNDIMSVQVLEALNAAIGIQPEGMRQYFDATRAMSLAYAKKTPDEITQTAKDYIKLNHAVLYSLQKAGANIEDINAELMATNWILRQGINDNTELQSVYAKIGELLGDADPSSVESSFKNRLASLFVGQYANADWENRLKMLPNNLLSEGEKEELIGQIKQNQERAATALIFEGLGEEE